MTFDKEIHCIEFTAANWVVPNSVLTHVALQVENMKYYE
jgi:hypothetical protein